MSEAVYPRTPREWRDCHEAAMCVLAWMDRSPAEYYGYRWDGSFGPVDQWTPGAVKVNP